MPCYGEGAMKFHNCTVWLRRIALALVALTLAGCETPYNHGDGRGTGANAVPANYRSLVARSLAKAVNPHAFRDAKISKPVIRNVDNLWLDVQPSVCVSAAPIAGGEYPAWIFVFQNGQVSRMIYPTRALGCRGLEWSPFPEFK